MKPLRISSISDIHLGNKRNTSDKIIANLNKHFSNDEHLSSIDMLVIVGDVFDTLLYLSDEYLSNIDLWIAKLLRLCYKHNVLVRVLEGTPSHDRNQSDRFRIINEIHHAKANKGIDLAYVKTLSIEHITRFNIDVLYVPDEVNHDTDTTFAEVQGLLAAKGLTKVDFAFIHGLFTYQMGSMIKDHIKHKEENYLPIVRNLIFIGHIHSHSSNDRIFAQGSFDRLCHNEEGPKGYLTAIVNPDNTYEVTFIENKTAMKFITVKCYHDEPEDNLKIISKAVKLLPPESYVRVESWHGNPIVSTTDTFKRRWPLLNWDVLQKVELEKEEQNMLLDDCIYQPINITPDTIVSLVMDRLNKQNLTADISDRCLMHLKELSCPTA